MKHSLYADILTSALLCGVGIQCGLIVALTCYFLHKNDVRAPAPTEQAAPVSVSAFPAPHPLEAEPVPTFRELTKPDSEKKE